MLRELYVRNFRTLRECRVEFCDSGLTVVVGPNGSGKTNLIRCLEFIGDIPSVGLEQAIRELGGPEAILPKALPKAEIRNSQIAIRYRFEVPGEAHLSPSVTTSCTHDLLLRVRSSSQVEVVSEQVIFSDVLAFQDRLASSPKRKKRESPVVPQSSSITVRREKDVVTVSFDPKPDSDNIRLYLDWWGLTAVEQKLGDFKPDELEEFIGQLFKTVARITHKEGRPRLYSLLDPPRIGTPLAMSNHAHLIAAHLAQIRRFDLQISELRRQQEVSADGELRSDGTGFPGAIRRLRSRTAAADRKRWQRIVATLEEISPHIRETAVNQLRTGQEYLAFIESRSGRAVESWHSSDGTLRALAILVALETAGDAVVLIEEPEQGLHPWAVKSLFRHIRSVIEQREVQVVVTTHSQQVLDAVPAAEVLVANRDEFGTHIQQITDIVDLSRLGDGDVGRLWVEGLLGGVPAS